MRTLSPGEGFKEVKFFVDTLISAPLSVTTSLFPSSRHLVTVAATPLYFVLFFRSFNFTRCPSVNVFIAAVLAASDVDNACGNLHDVIRLWVTVCNKSFVIRLSFDFFFGGRYCKKTRTRRHVISESQAAPGRDRIATEIGVN